MIEGISNKSFLKPELNFTVEFTYPNSPKGTGYIWVYCNDRDNGCHLPTFEKLLAQDDDEKPLYLYCGMYFRDAEGLEFFVQRDMPRMLFAAMAKHR